MRRWLRCISITGPLPLIVCQSEYRLQLADVGIGREISQMYPQEKLLNVLKCVHARRPIGTL